ncbi:SDR family NAD(P)-dependent oxidoreductase [Alicyclobacillus sp. ALC3]|uniref:SDR family NAD(P)-dependent oxidoreductase n=1 Tax=Alicyclobacillus sp. ALC3 TaxID=2796143 RepID=UPI0023785526|nr:SDR family NAD(P)-dependent oxidoreductase [Alicyclobacillus sp. ALC3]WDL97694.1 SDR family oxidoreductase [Alicyclobacillus sp. ALC3]
MEPKTVIVTGATRGIGRVIALAFARKGDNVVATGRDGSRLQSLREELKDFSVLPIVADLSQPKDVQNLIDVSRQHFGSLDVLVNNAGIAGPTRSIQDTAEDDWSELLDSNLTSAFLCCKFAVPHMQANGWGRIINVSSISAKRGLPFRAGYCATKAGLIGFTRSLAAELGTYGITVNTICPGFVDGDRMEMVINGQGHARGISHDAVRQEMEAASPLKRFVRAEEVAELVLFLASDYASAITGEDINVSAGVR